MTKRKVELLVILVILLSPMCYMISTKAESTTTSTDKYEWEYPLDNLKVKKADKIRVEGGIGSYYALACLTIEGDMYTWGWQRYYDDDSSKSEIRYTKTPQKVLSNVRDFKILGKESEPYAAAFAAITYDNELYLWGSCDDYEYFVDRDNKYGQVHYDTPKKILSGVSSLDNIYSYIGGSYVFILTDDFSLYRLNGLDVALMLKSVKEVINADDGGVDGTYLCAITSSNDMYVSCINSMDDKVESFVYVTSGVKLVSNVGWRGDKVFIDSNDVLYYLDCYDICNSESFDIKKYILAENVKYVYNYGGGAIYENAQGDMHYLELDDEDIDCDVIIDNFPKGMAKYLTCRDLHRNYYIYESEVFSIDNKNYIVTYDSKREFPSAPREISSDIKELYESTDSGYYYALYEDNTVHKIGYHHFYETGEKEYVDELIGSGIKECFGALGSDGYLFFGTVLNDNNLYAFKYMDTDSSVNEHFEWNILNADITNELSLICNGVDKIWYLDYNFNHADPEILALVTKDDGRLSVLRNMDFNYGINGSNNSDASSSFDSDSTQYDDEYIPIVKLNSVKSSKKKQMTVKWRSEGDGVDGYQIIYSKKKSFNSFTRRTVSYEKNKMTIKGLTKGKKYYVRVRAYINVDGEKKFGEWSRMVKVKIKK